MTTHPVPIMALYGGDSDRNPRLVVNAVQPGDTYVVLSFDDATGHRMGLALTPDNAHRLEYALASAASAVDRPQPTPKPAKPKRLYPRSRA